MMNEKEWIEFFELTQGRQPSQEDYQKALAAGEFKPNPNPVNQAQIQEGPKPVAQEIAPSQAPQAPGSSSSQVQASVPGQAPTSAPGQVAAGNPVPSARPVAPSAPNAGVPNPAPASPSLQNQASLTEVVVPQAKKPSAFKKMGQAFKKKDDKKGLPLWLNIGIMVVIALAFLGFGFWGHHSQKQVVSKLADGDWELKESAYYKDGDWEPYFNNGKFKYDKDTRSDSENSQISFNYYLSNKDGNFVLYNYFEGGSQAVSFSSYEHPTRTLTVNKQKHTASHRTDDDYAYMYSPAKPEKSENLDSYKVRYFRDGDELTFVYYDGSEPYYKETYRSMSKSKAKNIRSKVQKNYKDLEDYAKDPYGDDSDDSKSGTNGFQVG